jgi:putative transposase
MPRRVRERTAGLVFHVLNRAAKRAVLFENPADYAAFVRLLEKAVDRSDVGLFAYCVMPNHWHLVLAPKADGAVSGFMHWLTTTHARRWQNSHGLTGLGAVYQGRFKAIPIRSDSHFLWVCRYVERNPLRASLVTRAEDWKWSSLRGYHERAGWLAEWPVARPMEWIDHVNMPQTQAELDAFRHAIQNGIPFGDEGWKQQVRDALGTSPRHRHGRPRKQRSESVLEK